MDKLLDFIIANNFLFLLPFFVQKRFSASRPFSWFKVTKAQSAGEPILITLVSKEIVAIGVWVSRGPTSYTQELFL